MPFRTLYEMLPPRLRVTPRWLGGVWCYGWCCFSDRRSTLSTATSVSISSIPITIIGMPTTYSAVVPIARRRKLGLMGVSDIA